MTQDPRAEQEQERLREEMARLGQRGRRNAWEAAIGGLLVGLVTAAGIYGMGWLAGFEGRNVLMLSGLMFIVSAIGFWRLVA